MAASGAHPNSALNWEFARMPRVSPPSTQNPSRAAATMSSSSSLRRCRPAQRASREPCSGSGIDLIPFARNSQQSRSGAYYTPLQVLRRGKPVGVQNRPFRPPMVEWRGGQLWHGCCCSSQSIALVRGLPGMSNAVMGLRLKQQLTLTPRLQQSVKLLQLSALECVQELHQALAMNPFLEEIQESPDT